MIVDVNASVGHYPFRQLRFGAPERLVAHLARNGIERAVVASLHGAFYRDVHRANEELRDAARAHVSRLIPVATVNPRYVGWERDLAEAVEQWGMRLVTLLPEHHGYALNDAHGRAALERIAGLGVPVLLRQRFEDRRQRHAWDRAEDLTAAALLEAARTHPKLKFLLVNWGGLDGARLADAGMKGRCLIDFARLQVVFRHEVARLVETLGVEAIAFGSHAPFDYVGPSLVKLANVQATRPDDYEAIAWRNAARFLNLRE